ncbi:helix-turn-helix domain-containing protein [Anaerotignum sp. MB30-C6]|uniref:helix-turn-helix domain-containing protein n=1 Tax=Anaerotignum sp. MB30-C6 TaxID=3070814 RepID=UPI0027DE0B04|nr:helix-turn-helix transcriptional regulator [Anaerotignum sp. MB30-C6]WMI81273.1 helix-turn-helix transcriptional regulator [Anaerotignum sp. MB30-C6]
MAEKVNLSPQSIAEYEDGTIQPDIETLVNLSESTNVDIKHLIYGFPSVQAQKKQRREFIALSILTMVLWCFQVLLQKFVHEPAYRSFDVGLKIFYYTLAKPMFYTTLGWTIVTGVQLYLELKPLKGKHTHKLHNTIGLLLLAYFIFAIPPTFNALGDTYAYYLASKQGLGFSSTPIPLWLESWHYALMILIFKLYPSFYPIFIILGAAFGLTKTKEPAYNKKPQS